MPEIEFRTGLSDKLAYALRWLRVAAARGARTRVIGPPADLQVLDRALWVQDPDDFVPHLLLTGNALPVGCERTLIWLGDGELPSPAPSLLLNLGAEPPLDLAGVERIVELVGADEGDTLAGRQRWKLYVERSLAPHHLAADTDPRD
jgi:DNA polymerase-3 subunit chi